MANACSYAALMAEITSEEAARWPIGRPFAIRPCLQAITLEVIMRAVLGIDDANRLEQLRPRVCRLVEMSMGSGAALLPFVGRLRGRARWSPWGRFQQAVRSVDDVLFEEIRRRRCDPQLTDREDILSMLLQARDEHGDRLTDAELRDELVTLLLAGHETTATAGAWTIELLLRHPAALGKLATELSAGRTNYLDAVIQEALRLRPVIPSVGRRLQAPLTLNDYALPTGTNVSPCIYLLHRRPDIYRDPTAFRPERFLERPPETYQWIPFGGGTRRCIGASFATFELRVVLSTILARTSLTPAKERPERIKRKAVVLVPAHGVRVKLEASPDR